LYQTDEVLVLLWRYPNGAIQARSAWSSYPCTVRVFPMIHNPPRRHNPHLIAAGLLAGLLACGSASAGPLVPGPDFAQGNASQNASQNVGQAPVRQVAMPGPNLGGGFFEM